MIPAFITISADHTYDFEAQENAVKWRGIFVNPLRKVSLGLSLTVKFFCFKCQLHFVVLVVKLALYVKIRHHKRTRSEIVIPEL